MEKQNLKMKICFFSSLLLFCLVNLSFINPRIVKVKYEDNYTIDTKVYIYINDVFYGSVDSIDKIQNKDSIVSILMVDKKFKIYICGVALNRIMCNTLDLEVWRPKHKHELFYNDFVVSFNTCVGHGLMYTYSNDKKKCDKALRQIPSL